MVVSMVRLRLTTFTGADAPFMASVVASSDAGVDSAPTFYENIHFKSCFGITAAGVPYWTDGFAPDNEAATLTYNAGTGRILLTTIAATVVTSTTVASGANAALTATASVVPRVTTTASSVANAAMTATSSVRGATAAPTAGNIALTQTQKTSRAVATTSTANGALTATQTTARALQTASTGNAALTHVASSSVSSTVIAPLTRSASSLQVNGTSKRFGGANAYWLGLDDNNGVSFPTHNQITNAFTGMVEMGVNLVRAHSIGISTGTSQSYETAVGVYSDANLDAADYAVYQAKQKGIYLMVPLTDNWNYYHGGKWNFVHWAYQQNSSGITDTPGNIKDDPNERIFFANTTAGLRVRALFKDYISHWLNHVNPYTGLAYKNDPTIAIVETGNELYYASQLGTNEWTQDIASYIKSIAPNKLVADGSAADRVFVSNSPGLTASAVDIITAHYYPQQQSGSYPSVSFNDTSSGYAAGSALQQITADATAASNAGKVFFVGEYPWTRSDVASVYSLVESTPSIDSDMFWSFVANTDGGVAEAHGGAFGSDDYPVHRPYSGSSETAYAPALAQHISVMSGIANTNGAGTAPAATPNLLATKTLTHASDPSMFAVGSGTSALDTSVYQEGGSSLQITPSGTGVYPYIYFPDPTTGAPVTANNTYTAVVSVRTSTSGNFGFQTVLNWYDSSGGYLSNTTGSYVSTPQASWTQVTASGPAPMYAAYATVQIQAGSAMNATDLFNLDEFGVFAGSNTIWSA